MRFWDSSAVVPLLVEEPPSAAGRSLLAEDPDLVIWWTTPVECASALWRRHRAGRLDPEALDEALEDLALLVGRADEVLPAEGLRERAVRLLAVHALGAADALQLAAALLRSREQAASFGFVSLDARLREAARREGFAVLPSGAK